jgi:alkylated DNA repair dioxygenase AlkB
MDLFSDEGLQPIPIEDGELALLHRLPLPVSNAEVFARLLAETAWRHETIVVYGKRHLQPRLTAWYGEASYTYSGLRLEPLPMTPLLGSCAAAVEAATGHRYNSVLLNYYRDGATAWACTATTSRNSARIPPSPRSAMAPPAALSCVTNAANAR